MGLENLGQFISCQCSDYFKWCIGRDGPWFPRDLSMNTFGDRMGESRREWVEDSMGEEWA